MDKDAILTRMASIHFPDPGGVIIVGGTAMAMLGIRKAEDIDLLLSWQNWRYVSTLPDWKLTTSYGRRHFISIDGDFDAWRWWFDTNARRRISFQEIASHCLVTQAGYLLPTADYQIAMKRQLDRPKDRADIERIVQHRST